MPNRHPSFDDQVHGQIGAKRFRSLTGQSREAFIAVWDRVRARRAARARMQKASKRRNRR